MLKFTFKTGRPGLQELPGAVGEATSSLPSKLVEVRFKMELWTRASVVHAFKELNWASRPVGLEVEFSRRLKIKKGDCLKDILWDTTSGGFIH